MEACGIFALRPAKDMRSVVWKERKNWHKSLVDSYGPFIALVVSIRYPNMARDYSIIEQFVLQGNESDALFFRQSVTDQCNMTAVSGAIIAQVSITGLSLPNLAQVHWTASGCLYFSFAASCFSVFCACHLQRTIAKLYDLHLIRDWLSKPPSNSPSQTEEQNYKIKASLPALLLVDSPFELMAMSLGALLAGLGIYQGLIWKNNLNPDSGKAGSRNVLIVFLVALVVCWSSYFLASQNKIIESILLDDMIKKSPTRFQRSNQRSQAVAISSLDGRGTSRLENSRSAHVPQNNVSAEKGQASVHQTSGREESSNALKAALEAAADAQTQSAEASRRVASEYRKIAQTMGR
ncbi:MAG: hypothetical protein Q9167_001495 [Letrouitia subvulpina]